MSILKLKDSQGNWISVPTLKGDKGNGIQSAVLNNDYTLTLTFTDGTTYTTPSIRGEKGEKGEPATDMDIHICSASEYDSETRIPTITSPDNKTFYLVPTEDGASPDLFTEWVYVNNAWEMFGSASVDLSGYLTDVTVNGTSVVTEGVAEIPVASSSTYGVIKLNTNGSEGIQVNSNTGRTMISAAYASLIKAGNDGLRPIVPTNQHQSAFYGLAKASGADEKDSTLAVGSYTDNAKDKIQTMLGVSPLIAPHESDPFESAHAVGELFIVNGKLYRAKTALTAGEYVNEGTNVEVVDVAEVLDSKVDDVQVNGTSVVTDGVANIPRAGNGIFGVGKINSNLGIDISNNGELRTTSVSASNVKAGTSSYLNVPLSRQHESTFYGLAKASGDSTQAQSDNAVGTYTDEAKASIKNMLGVQDNIVVTVEQNETSDWQADKTYTEIRTAIIKGINVIVDDDTYLLPYVGQLYQNNILWFAFGISTVFNNTNMLFGYLIGDNSGQTIVTQINQNTPIPQIDDSTTGSNTVWSSGKIKDELDYKVNDVTIDGSSIATDGVAEIPIAGNTDSTHGVVSGWAAGGVVINAGGRLQISTPSDTSIKQGSGAYVPIVAQKQHQSVFYGLTKAAGVDMSTSSNAVGTYTDEAKTAIKQMLGVHDAYDSFIEEIDGTDVTITGQPSYRYNCGEVYSLTVTPPSSGTIDFRFTSGSSPTVLTLPSTVKMPEWWVEVEANTIYEMCITDGVYCGVMSWAM